MRKIILPILLVSSFYMNAQSHGSYIDSLYFEFRKAPNDTIRMDVMRQMGFYYQPVNGDSSRLLLEQCVSLAEKLNLRMYAAGIMSGQIYALAWNDYPKALELSRQALKIAEDPASEQHVWGMVPGHNPYTERMATLGAIYQSIAQLYGNTGQIEKQKLSLEKSIEMSAIAKDSTTTMYALLKLGTVYLDQHKPDSALVHEQRALHLASEIYTDNSGLGWIYGMIGAIYLEKKNYDSSGAAYSKALQCMKKDNNLAGIGMNCLSLSRYYKIINKPDSSLLYGYLALETYKKFKDTGGIANADSSLSVAYEKKNMTDSAFAYLKLSAALREQLSSKDRKNLITYQNANMEEQLRLKNLEEADIQTNNKIKIYSMVAGIAVCLVIASILFRNNQTRKKANILLEKQKQEIAEQKENVEQTLTELKSTQAQLIQSEKMASLGELTAGIAHEIQNPLNFINNFSEVNKELLVELKEEVRQGNANAATDLANNLIDNEEKINHHGKRADSIVKGMLQHSRQTSGIKESTDINALCDEYLKLSYHGLRARDKTFNADFKTDFDETMGMANIVRQDIGRCLLNIFNNAFYAVNEKQKTADPNYKPLVSIQTKRIQDQIEIKIKDNGNGIPQNVINKIFQPFFTTKPTGQGTGLGLSLAYDIITKEHGGTLKVESETNQGSAFIIQLPGER